MSQDDLQAALERMKALPIETKVARYIQLRDAKAKHKREFEARAAEFDFLMQGIQNYLLAEADAKGVTGFKCDGVGTTYTAENQRFSIADDAAFRGFVLETADLDFFERRVGSKHVQEWMKENRGILPPGLNVFREREMRVRKAGEKPKD